MADIKKEIIELAQQLIRFKSTKDNPQELKNCLDFVASYLKKFSVIKRFRFKNKPSLVAYYKNIKPKFFLVGHLDVVEAPNEQFKPTIKGNKLFGRGAADMKGGVAIMLALFKELAKEQEKPPFGLMITTDEEIGGHNGTGELVKRYKSKFVIVPEPNQSEKPGQLNITIKHKGVLWLKIKAKGKAAHSSMPWLGDNAIDKLILVYERIREKFCEITPNTWNSTINLSVISGGETPNKIPDYAEAIVDIRWIENFDKDKFLDSIKDLDAEFEIVEYSPMLDNDKNNKYIKLLQNCVRKQTGQNCLLLKMHGATDAKFFSVKGIPAVVFGPFGKNYHALGEYLDLNTIVPTYNALKEFLLKCSKM
ncbi:MAG: M20/M25/M40 family metallo-hydrolase [Candidatus Nanoarchaeia archaeon]